MGLAQYHLVKWSHGNSLGTSRRTGNPLNMSSVFLEFTFQRRQGFYILQVHKPFKRFTNKNNVLLLFLFWSRKKSTFSCIKGITQLPLTFQIYVPLTLIVCCSWVTFWLVKTEKGTEIPARTSLGATTVLSVVTIGFGGKSKPQVSNKWGYPRIISYLNLYLTL